MKTLSIILSAILSVTSAFGQGGYIGPKGYVGPSGYIGATPGLPGGTLSLVQFKSCVVGNPATTCSFSTASNLAAGNLDVFDCTLPDNAPFSISSVSNAGGTLVNSVGAGTGSFQTGGTGGSPGAAYILPSTSTGGSGVPVATLSVNNTSSTGANCYMAEWHPSANPSRVGLDIDTAYQTPTAGTSATNATAVTLSGTSDVAVQGAMSLDTFTIVSSVASPYNTNAFLANAGGFGWSGYSTATSSTGNWANWVMGSSGHTLLQSLYFGYNPTACQAQTFVDFENSTTGTAVTNALLFGTMKGWQGGQWTSTVNLIQFNSAASMPLRNPTGRLCDGTSAAASAGTLGLQVTGSGSAVIDFVQYSWGAGLAQPNVIAAMKFNENLLANSNSDQDCLSVHGASDFASCNAYGTGATRFIGLETIGGNGSAINAPGGTWVGTCPCDLVIFYDSGSGGIAPTSVSGAVAGSTVTFTGTFTASQWPANFAFTPSGCTGGTNYNGNAFLVQTSSASTVTASTTTFPNGGTAPVSPVTVSGSATGCTLTGQHLLVLNNSSGTQIGASFHAGTVGANNAQYLVMGTPNNQAIPAGKFMNFDSLQLSFNGVIPSL